MSEVISLLVNEEGKLEIDEFIKRFPICASHVEDHYKLPNSQNNVGLRNQVLLFKNQHIVPPLPQQVPSAIQKFRSSLPIYGLREKVLSTIEKHEVTLVTGGTGCGKTTQVPQFLLEEAALKKIPIRIICTQPRRLPTIAISKRVAVERGEQLGATVGYHIRLENRLSPNTALIYCTSGVLLRMLTADSVAAHVTHIILDEVHEREQNTDYLLIAIKQALAKRNNLKVILMSATMEGNISTFMNYFDTEVGYIDVPSRLFSVEKFYLADILAMTSYLLKFKTMQLDSQDTRLFERNVIVGDFPDSQGEKNNRPRRDLSPDTFGEQASISRFGSFGFKQCRRTELDDALKHLKRVFPDPPDHFTTCVSETLKNSGLRRRPLENVYTNIAQKNPDGVDAELTVKMILYLLDSSVEGAILVFLPGYEDIMQVYDRLTFVKRQAKKKAVIYLLHSQINPKDQQNVFDPVGKGCRKVILSTNIAEASLTIDDVVFVIDSGKVKEMSYDHSTRVTQLKMAWIAKSNAEQRSGRAGRCRHGYCFRLYSELDYKQMLDAQVPEMQRAAIHDVCLHAKMFAPKNMSVKDFLGMAPEPPPSNAVQQSLEFLEQLDALYTDKTTRRMISKAPRGFSSVARIQRPLAIEPELTELGHMLAMLPLEPRLSRLLLFGLALKCFDPIITLVSVLSYRDPFVLPVGDERTDALKVRDEFSRRDFSDHLMMIRAFYAYSHNSSSSSNNDFCRSNFLSPPTMKMIFGIRKQLLSELRRISFLPNGVMRFDDPEINTYRGDWPMIQGAIVGGCHPGIAVVRDGIKLRKIRISNNEKNVMLHPSSVIRRQAQRRDKISEIARKNADDDVNPVIDLLVYQEMARLNDGITIKVVTAVTPLPVFFFSGSIRANRCDMEKFGLVSVLDNCKDSAARDIDDKSDKKVSNDSDSDNDADSSSSSMSSDDGLFEMPLHSWISFNGTFATMQSLVRLRHKFMAYFLKMLKNPSRNTTEEDHRLLECISHLLNTDHRSSFYQRVEDLKPHRRSQKKKTNPTPARCAQPFVFFRDEKLALPQKVDGGARLMEQLAQLNSSG